jgi:hypothetical protein
MHGLYHVNEPHTHDSKHISEVEQDINAYKMSIYTNLENIPAADMSASLKGADSTYDKDIQNTVFEFFNLEI